MLCTVYGVLISTNYGAVDGWMVDGGLGARGTMAPGSYINVHTHFAFDSVAALP